MADNQIDMRSFGTAMDEVTAMLLRVELWSTLAWNDIKLRYRRTTLGPLWITLGLGTTVLSVGLLYGALFGNELSQYLPYFTAGLIAWTFLSAAIGEGCGAYLGAAFLIRAIPIPLVVHVYRMLARQLIMLAHNLVLVVVMWAVFQWPLNWNVLLVVPGLAINVVAACGFVLFLSVVAARFRDVLLIVMTLLQLIFLITPIMWETKSLKGASIGLVADLNPFYHLIEVVRRPLLSEPAALLSWAVAILTACVAVLIGLHFYARYRHRVPFWI